MTKRKPAKKKQPDPEVIQDGRAYTAGMINLITNAGMVALKEGFNFTPEQAGTWKTMTLMMIHNFTDNMLIDEGEAGSKDNGKPPN
jgi:hypothetical protein